MGQPKPGPVVQTNKTELGDEQQAIFDMAFPSIQQYASSQPSLFPGSSIAGFSPYEMQGQQAALGAVPTAGNLASASANAQSHLLDPNFMLNPNQYVLSAADAMTRRVTDNLQQNILPNIRSTSAAAAGPYAFNTREGIATGQAIGDTNQGLSDALSDMLLANYTQGLGHMSQAIAGNPSVMQQQLFPSNILSSVGGQQRGMEQAQLDEQIRQFYAQQDLPLSRAQQLMNLIAGMPGGTGVTTVQPSMPKTNPMSQILGNAMMALGVMTGMPTMGSTGANMMGTGMGTTLGMGK